MYAITCLQDSPLYTCLEGVSVSISTMYHNSACFIMVNPWNFNSLPQAPALSFVLCAMVKSCQLAYCIDYFFVCEAVHSAQHLITLRLDFLSLAQGQCV